VTDRGRIGLAVLLTAVAGWVDAVGYLELGRLFVSFMSGNSTLLAIGLAGVDRTAIAGAALSVALYSYCVRSGDVCGTGTEGLTGSWQQGQRGKRRAKAIARRRRTEAIECGLWRSGRLGTPSGPPARG